MRGSHCHRIFPLLPTSFPSSVFTGAGGGALPGGSLLVSKRTGSSVSASMAEKRIIPVKEECGWRFWRLSRALLSQCGGEGCGANVSLVGCYGVKSKGSWEGFLTIFSSGIGVRRASTRPFESYRVSLLSAVDEVLVGSTSSGCCTCESGVAAAGPGSDCFCRDGVVGARVDTAVDGVCGVAGLDGTDSEVGNPDRGGAPLRPNFRRAIH